MGTGREFDHTSSHLDEDFEGYEEWLDELGEEEAEDALCDLCQGTGIGQHGDPNTSKCAWCRGRGVSPKKDKWCELA